MLHFVVETTIILGTCKLPCLVCYLSVSVSSFSMSFFFCGIFKVGLNTQQNSPAAHCSAINHHHHHQLFINMQAHGNIHISGPHSR